MDRSAGAEAEAGTEAELARLRAHCDTVTRDRDVWKQQARLEALPLLRRLLRTTASGASRVRPPSR